MSAVKENVRPFVTKRAASVSLSWKRVGIYAGVAGVVFLLGLIPMWLKARDYASQRDAAQHELRLSRLENSLSEATIDARRAQYEPARQTASDFFTELRAQVEKEADADLTATQRESVRPLLAQRDEVITLLARSDPAAADRLSDIYVKFRGAMSNVQPQGGN